jgi:hypothetical protein
VAYATIFSFKILEPTEMPMRYLTLADKIALLEKIKNNCLMPVITNWQRQFEYQNLKLYMLYSSKRNCKINGHYSKKRNFPET